MKYWTSLHAQKNILCNNNISLSKKEINRILDKKNIKNYKYYYVLPDCNAANVIFTDRYLPDIETINRNFTYGEEEFISFNQTDAYKELLKENSNNFDFFVNSYFLELGINELSDNGIQFVSYTNIRKEQYRIQTIIYNDRVEKEGLNEKSVEHIHNIEKNIDVMNMKDIKTLDKYENGKIISNYIKNEQTYDKELLNLLMQGEKIEFFDKVNSFKLFLMEKLEKVEFEDIKGKNIFTEYDMILPDEMLSNLNFVKFGLWDLIFQNAFHINDDLYFFDQEWMNYNVPVEFIIYRAIAYFPSVHAFIKTDDLYKTLNIEKYREIFSQLDEKIQSKIRYDEIWNLHKSTKTGQELINLYNELKIRLQSCEDELNVKQGTIDELLNQINEFNNKIDELKDKIYTLNDEKNDIYASTSWKLTKPVRWLGNKIKYKGEK